MRDILLYSLSNFNSLYNYKHIKLLRRATNIRTFICKKVRLKYKYVLHKLNINLPFINVSNMNTGRNPSCQLNTLLLT